MTSLCEFREKYPFKPYQIVRFDGKQAEVISFPFENGDEVRIMIRTVPHDPTTLQEVSVAEILVA